jgi:hypothetical protein
VHSDDGAMNEDTGATPRPPKKSRALSQDPIPIPAINREMEEAKARVVSGDEFFFDRCHLRNK